MGMNEHNPVNILMVDDNLADIELMRDALGEEVELSSFAAARNGDEALRYLRQEGAYHDAKRPDLILLDINMPGKTGFDVLREIRQDHSLACIPVIILSGSSDDHDVDLSYRLTANAYLTKPVGLEALTRMIHALERFWLESARLPTAKCL